MNKLLILLVLSFLVFGIALSFPIVIADDGDDHDDNETEEDDDNETEDENETEEREGSGKNKIKFEVRRSIADEDGNVREVRIKIEERIIDGEVFRKIRIVGKIEGDVEAKTRLELREIIEGNESLIEAILSDGNRTKIKIMPDRASEIALERLKGKNFTIELKEIIHKNIPRVIYNIETNKNGRFLGIFKLKMKIEGQVDPETGEFIGISKPWWAFLVVGESSDETGNGNGNGNGDNNETENNETNGNETENQITVELTEINSSNESGTAMLVEENGQVIVTLSMIGASENVSQPAHIHVGSCPEVGEVKYPLINVLDGESVTTLNVTLDQLEIELPLAINVHKSVNESSVYVSCGDIQF